MQNKEYRSKHEWKPFTTSYNGRMDIFMQLFQYVKDIEQRITTILNAGDVYTLRVYSCNRCHRGGAGIAKFNTILDVIYHFKSIMMEHLHELGRINDELDALELYKTSAMYTQVIGRYKLYLDQCYTDADILDDWVDRLEEFLCNLADDIPT